MIQRRPPEIESAHNRYKKHGAQITRWLIRQAEAHDLTIVGSPDSRYDLQLKEYCIRRRVRAPRAHKSYFNAIIKLRTRCWKWYRTVSPNHSCNGTHFAFIEKMRRLRHLWFATPVGYDTADSDTDEPLESLFVGAMSFAFDAVDTEDDDANSDSDQDSEEELEEEGDLSSLPLSVFQIFADDEDVASDPKDLQLALVDCFQELQTYRNCLRDLMQQEQDPPSSLALFLVTRRLFELASDLLAKLATAHSSMKNAEYVAVLHAILGGDDQLGPLRAASGGDDHLASGSLLTSFFVDHQGGPETLRSYLMIDTYTVCRASLSMTEGAMRSYLMAMTACGLTAKRCLMAQLCLRLLKDNPIDAVWLGRNGYYSRRLHHIVESIVASAQQWLHVHSPSHYADQSATLELRAHDLIAYATTILDIGNRFISDLNPLEQGQQEIKLLEQSWKVGKELLFSPSPNRIFALMALYRHVRTHTNLGKIRILEHLRKFVFQGPLGSLCCKTDIHPPSPLENHSLSSAREWVNEYEEELGLWAIDFFTLDRMVVAVLRQCMQETAQALVTQLGLMRHPEGGFFVETDRQKEEVGTPFVDGKPQRSLGTSIYYLLSRDSPNGYFHTNKSVTYHVHHQGRAEYTLITPRPGQTPLVERRIIGPNSENGETRQLLVGTGVWKMSRLLNADLKNEALGDRVGCLITEVVVPGFHWEDHAFLTKEGLKTLFGDAKEAQEFVPYVKA
ncbi:cupin-5 domain-containing protein [Favolaschia claudopus]|uniref:Cupin-5 domain-containing protein n=1 Tax=Favolaschia claudopus TaxID=2862362 RepID=A0AAW0DI84_9AGAR